MVRITCLVLLSQLLCLYTVQAQEKIAQVNSGTIKVVKKEKYLMPAIVGKTKGAINPALLIADTLGIVVDDDDVKIIGFNMLIQDKGDRNLYLINNSGSNRGFSTKGNQLSMAQKQSLAIANREQEIIITNIKAQKGNAVIELPSLHFEVEIPIKLQAFIGHKYGGRIDHGTYLCRAQKLTVNDPEVIITSFTLSTVTKGKWTKNSSGINKITDAMCKVLHATTQGSRIIFENIKARNAADEIIDVPSMTFEIY
jgi:hypothetical protein